MGVALLLSRDIAHSRWGGFALLLAVLLVIFCPEARGSNSGVGRLASPEVRTQAVEYLAQRSQQRKAAAWQLARQQGWIPQRKVNDRLFELMAIEGDRVYVYQTCNMNSAISIGVDLVRNVWPYDVNGSSMIVGIWDAGAVRASHQEFGSRVLVIDGGSSYSHSTHVAGTVAAAGIQANAMGMAPNVFIDSYDWDNDTAEMTARAMSYASEPGTIQVSNHSYGYACGWDTATSPPHWYGTWGYRECEYFGAYDSEVAQWDELCYNGPYYLPFKAAGNDRTDKAPADGELFDYYKWPKWREKVYDSNNGPCDDGWDNGGFDTVLTISCAKNVMTVGAVYDAVSSGLRDTSKGTMTSFSGWGPTDDGRIKPDVVTNGVSVYSCTASSDTSYASYNGTSMAAPAAAGAATLLLDYYQKLFGGQTMRASTIKALMIHTADDLGNAGPDYKFGWGLVNAKAAANVIRNHNSFPDANVITEDVLTGSDSSKAYSFERGSGVVRATLCWTDPAAAELGGLDNPSPRLINDLDLRIIAPGGSTYYPFVLDPSNPDQPATTGDNVLDNVEQVLIEDGNSGTYTVEVSYKGTLTNGQQYYSLIIDGQQVTDPIAGDLNGDREIDYRDLDVLAEHWLDSFTLADISPEGGDGIVNLLDFSAFAENW